MRHPFLHPLSHFYLYLAIWACVVMAHSTFLSQVYQVSLEASVFDGLLFNVLISGFCVGIWYAVRWTKPDTNRLGNILFVHLGAISLFLLFWACTGEIASSFLFPNELAYHNAIHEFLPIRLFIGMMYYLATVLFYYLYIYYTSFQNNRLKEASLETIVKETQLELLKSQLNPHFIFNSLNSVSSLTLSNPAKAQEMVIKLSAFLRSSLGHKHTHMMPLQDELENGLLYLQIEQVRFGEKLQFTWTTDPDCMQQPVPDMILQPLLENAVKHGVYESTDQVHVRLECRKAPDGCEITIQNEVAPETSPKSGKGLGIKNVRERLRLLYGQGDLLTTTYANHTFTARLILPISTV